VTYPVTFAETGLSAGIVWSATLDGVDVSSGTDTIAFSGLVNGTYPFTIGQVPGYTLNLSGGSIAVDGGAASESIAFTPVPPPPTTFLGLSAAEAYAMVAGIVSAVVVTIMVGLLVRPRRKGPRTLGAEVPPPEVDEPLEPAR
jgi:hypothetical protein